MEECKMRFALGLRKRENLEKDPAAAFSPVACVVPAPSHAVPAPLHVVPAPLHVVPSPVRDTARRVARHEILMKKVKEPRFVFRWHMQGSC